MLLLSVTCLAMTLYVLLSGESHEVVSRLPEAETAVDSMKEAWVMVKDSLHLR
ncbi:MAG: hypothetical protein NWR72_04185 [Bacteroidia bacterium]|nr:hypothetical protein [Bacteroidia bacterium]